MKNQILVVYTHEERKLFYVSSINFDRIKVEGNVEKQYSRAKSLHKKMLANESGEVYSGFMYALINTDFTGWEVVHNSEEVQNAFANHERASLIDRYEELGYVNVGAHDKHTKVEIGTGKSGVRWNVKLNVTKMTKPKIFEKIEFLFRSAVDKPGNDLVNALYMAIVCPDSHGPRSKNFGSYQVESLATMFMFSRNYQGLDLQ